MKGWKTVSAALRCFPPVTSPHSAALRPPLDPPESSTSSILIAEPPECEPSRDCNVRVTARLRIQVCRVLHADCALLNAERARETERKAEEGARWLSDEEGKGGGESSGGCEVECRGLARQSGGVWCLVSWKGRVDTREGNEENKGAMMRISTLYHSQKWPNAKQQPLPNPITLQRKQSPPPFACSLHLPTSLPTSSLHSSRRWAKHTRRPSSSRTRLTDTVGNASRGRRARNLRSALRRAMRSRRTSRCHPCCSTRTRACRER